jgi:DNA invertase Pin-like site-specific DNA recombinase
VSNDVLSRYNKRLTPADYDMIRRMRAEGIKNSMIARVMGCSKMHVGRVLRGKVVADVAGTPTALGELSGDAASAKETHSRV